MNEKAFGKKLFEVGPIQLTQSVVSLVKPEFMEDAGVAGTLYSANATRAIRKMVFLHQCGFWGDVSPDCVMLNEADAQSGPNEQVYILSVYYFDVLHPHKTNATKDTKQAVKLWIVTDGAGEERHTTVLDPEWDY